MTAQNDNLPGSQTLEVIPVGDGRLKYTATSDLEKYRIESIFDKEPETIAWIEGWRLEAPVFWDIGANIGIFSLYAAHKHPDATVLGFEPVSDNFTSLVRNVSVNPGIRVFPFHLALSDGEKISDLFLSDLRIGNSGAQIEAPRNDKGEQFQPLKVEKVLSIRMDHLVEKFGFPSPNYVKIDVDGRETSILAGMERLIRGATLKSILVELNNQAEFDLWLGTLGAAGFHLDQRLDSLPNHSVNRRKQKGNAARNYIFSRD